MRRCRREWLLALCIISVQLLAPKDCEGLLAVGVRDLALPALTPTVIKQVDEWITGKEWQQVLELRKHEELVELMADRGFISRPANDALWKEVEAEVLRLEQLKASKMKDLVLKKQTELEEHRRRAHLVGEEDYAAQFSIEAIEAERERERLREGTPRRARQSRADLSSVYEMHGYGRWGCPPGKFPLKFDARLTCYLLKGRVKASVKGSSECVEFGAGDLVVFPEGLSCTWDVVVGVDKHYNFDSSPN